MSNYLTDDLFRPRGNNFRDFRLGKTFVAEFTGRQPNWGFGDLSYFTYKRTYANALPGGGFEEYWQTVQRVVEGMFNVQKIHCHNHNLPWNDRKAQRSARVAFQLMWDFKWLPAGRGISKMGTRVMYARGGAMLNSCGFTTTANIDHDFAEPFRFLMDMSMLGVGIGLDMKGAGKVSINPIPKMGHGQTLVVPDTREGWADGLDVILKAFAEGGTLPEAFDFSLVRPEGAPIEGFGGVASGPGPLIELYSRVIALLSRGFHVGLFDSEVLGKHMVNTTRCAGEWKPAPITSTEIADLANYIGKCVESGGVRRSAEILFSEPTDEEFCNLKNEFHEHRTVSNNSIFSDTITDWSEYARDMVDRGFSRLGFMNLQRAREYGRMSDPRNDKDSRAMGANPCCVPGNALIQTSDGVKTAKSLVNKTFSVTFRGEEYESEGFWETGHKEVFEVTTVEGYKVRATADHRILTTDGWVELGSLGVDHELVLGDNRNKLVVQPGNENFSLGWLSGMFVGDGHHHVNGARLQFWGADKELLLDQCSTMLDSLIEGGRKSSHHQVPSRDMVGTSSRWLTEQLLGTLEPDSKVVLPAIHLKDRAFKAGWLAGMFDADGHVEASKDKGASIRLTSSTLQHLEVAQRLLLDLGIKSRIYKNRQEGGLRQMPDGKGGTKGYECKAVHQVVISKDSMVRFRDVVGFTKDTARQEKLDTLLASYSNGPYSSKFTARYESTVSLGVMPVFDCTVEGVHQFESDGVVVHNCEQTLEDKELCCLVETFPARHDSAEEYHLTLKYAYLYAKSVTLIQTHWAKTNAVMLRNRRIGTSQSGIVQNLNKVGWHAHFNDYCRAGYDAIQRWDKTYSDWLCVCRSIKTTSVKPSGTVSLLAGATPGVHDLKSEYYIRRVNVSRSSPYLDMAREAGYKVGKRTPDGRTWFVEFPVHVEDMPRAEADVSVREQLGRAAQMQADWADNQVSVTVNVMVPAEPDFEDVFFDNTYDGYPEVDDVESEVQYAHNMSVWFNAKKEVADDLSRALDEYAPRLKGCSFIVNSTGHYENAPYEPITRERYLDLLKDVRTLDMSGVGKELEESGCDGGVCELKF